jgi:predicted Fe-S protein YdhL (DUF1289 family)
MTARIANPVIRNFRLQTHIGSLPSPCISVCVMDPQTGWCKGCFRTIDEIARWSAADEQEKRAVWIEIKRRSQAEGTDAAASVAPLRPACEGKDD